MTQRQHQALFETAISCIVAEAARAAGDHCEYSAWAASIQSLVPRRYEFSSAASDTSNDGAARLTEWYGPNWDQVWCSNVTTHPYLISKSSSHSHPLASNRN